MDRSVRTRKSSSSERSMERKASQSPPPRRHHNQHHHQNLHGSINGRQKKQHQVWGGKAAAVVYYLSRSWQMEHPHFIEVPNPSPEGLFLRDVINRLCVLRGKRLAYMYSWSCKRSYKNGFVWHDISEDDLIDPTNGNEYVLKGSEIIDVSPSDRRERSIPRMNPITERAIVRSQEHRLSSPPPEELLRQSSSSETTSPEAIKSIASKKRGGNMPSRANASTQTDVALRCNRRSTPRSDTLEALIRAEPMWSKTAEEEEEEEEAKVVRAGDILRQILTCGASLPESRPRAAVVAAAAATLGEVEATGGRRRREWYSGSFVEMKRRMEKGGRGGGRGGATETHGIPLKRSSSHRENRRHGSPPPEEIMAKNGRKDRDLNCSMKPNDVIVFSQRPVDIAKEESKRKKKISKGRVRPHVAQSPRASSSNGLSLKDMPTARSASSCMQD